MSADAILPGDLLLIRDHRKFGRLIRLGAALRDQPDTWNHVIVATHTDEAGAQWGIEGRPGGVGWVELGTWLADRWTLDNAGQPKTDEQRAKIVEIAKGLLGREYDWTGIIADAMTAIGARRVWKMRAWGQRSPAQVVCSSLAAWIYEQVGLAGPGTVDRLTTPADWASFVLTRAWQVGSV